MKSSGLFKLAGGDSMFDRESGGVKVSALGAAMSYSVRHSTTITETPDSHDIIVVEMMI